MPKKLPTLPFLLVLVSLVLSGCGALNPFSGPGVADTPQALLEAGQKAMDKGNYGQAAKYFQRIKEDHPFSRETAEAELGLADAYFRQGKHAKAESAYKEYESLHPGDPKIPYVLFRIGRANLRQFVSIDLSQQEVRESEEYFTRLVQGYPQSEYTADAREQMHKCRKLRAYHEIYVADFYMRTEKYRAAWRRYTHVRDTFTSLEECVQYARERGREAYYLALRQASEEARVAKRGSWKEWFNWL